MGVSGSRMRRPRAPRDRILAATRPIVAERSEPVREPLPVTATAQPASARCRRAAAHLLLDDVWAAQRLLGEAQRLIQARADRIPSPAPKRAYIERVWPHALLLSVRPYRLDTLPAPLILPTDDPKNERSGPLASE